MTTNPENENPPQQLINGELKPLVGMEATSHIPVIKSKAEYLKAVMYEGVRLSQNPPPPRKSPLETCFTLTIDSRECRSRSSKAQQPGARNAGPSRPKSPKW